jgi:hypothetical protein
MRTQNFQNGSDAEDVKHEGDEQPEKPDAKARALGIGGINLRFGLSLVCGLFVHGESVAQDRRFNRRKRNERRGTGEIVGAGLMRSDIRSGLNDPHTFANDGHVPLSKVPVEALLCRLKRAASAENRRVDGPDGAEWEATQVEDGPDAEDVKQKEDCGPDQPAEANTPLGVGGINLRFGSVCGLIVHARSLGAAEKNLTEGNEVTEKGKLCH